MSSPDFRSRPARPLFGPALALAGVLGLTLTSAADAGPLTFSKTTTSRLVTTSTTTSTTTDRTYSAYDTDTSYSADSADTRDTTYSADSADTQDATYSADSTRTTFTRLSKTAVATDEAEGEYGAASADAPVTEGSSNGPTAGATGTGAGTDGTSGPVVTASLFEDLSAALELDILTNPAYSDETKSILLEQLATDFAGFSEIGSTGGGTRFQAARAPTLSLTPTSGLLLREVSLQNPYTRLFERQPCPSVGGCPLPLAWNVPPRSVELVWVFDTDAAYFAFRAATEGAPDTELALKLGGVLVNRVPTGQTGGFWAVYHEDPGDCGATGIGPCIRVVIDRSTWFSTAPPWSDWSVSLEAWSLEALEVHQIGFDRFGNPYPIREAWERQEQAHATVLAPETLSDFFTATIGASTASARCTTCHSLSTPAKIVEHHMQNGAGISESIVVDLPSAVIPGETILGCDSCHYIVTPNYYEFHEDRWATPPSHMDIDWARIIDANPNDWSREVCERITTHLPTASIRAQHFHEDARLFWAVQDGTPPLGHAPLERAQPQDYNLFLKHFDAWNEAGARCPQ